MRFNTLHTQTTNAQTRTCRQQKVLGYKPGITDVASLAYFEENRLLAESQDPHRTYVEEIMPEKLRLNLDYQQKANVLTDIGVVIRTALRILK
jgi:lipopolysaccharide/colanic/teichoic acid biosynthesis glycosyltransferase